MSRSRRRSVAAALAAGLVCLAAPPAHSADKKLVLRTDGAVRVPPDEEPARHLVRIRAKGGTARNVKISIVAFRDLRAGVGVSSAGLEVTPRALRRVTKEGREVSLVILDPASLAAGTYEVRLVARAPGVATTNARLELLVGAPGSVSIAPSNAEYSAIERWPWRCFATLCLGEDEWVDQGDRDDEEDQDHPISFQISGEGGGYVHDATVSITGLVNVETERSVPGAVFADGNARVVRQSLGLEQTAEVDVVVPSLPEPGIYNLGIAVKSAGSDVVTEANVRVVVSHGPAPAVVILGLGVLLSFAVTYLRARRSRVMSRRKAVLFETRVDSWARVNRAYEDLPLVRTLRATRGQIEFIAGSEGAVAADEYLRQLQDVYEALNEVVAYHDRVGTTRGRLETVRASAVPLLKDSTGESELRTAAAEAKRSEDALSSEFGRVMKELSKLDVEHGSKSAASTSQKLRKLAEAKAELLTQADQRLAALEKAIAQPVEGVVEGDDYPAAGEGALETPLSGSGSPMRIALEPPSPRAEEAAVIHLKPYFAIPPMSRSVWVVSKVSRWRRKRTALGVFDDAYESRGYEFPEKGTYEITVDIDGARIAETVVRVRRSTIADQQREVFRIDGILSLISFAFALVTGMWIFYYREGIAYFGAPQHYIELFLWGIGIDAATKSLRGVRDRVEGGPTAT